jgi:hypothetical protein
MFYGSSIVVVKAVDLPLISFYLLENQNELSHEGNVTIEPQFARSITNIVNRRDEIDYVIDYVIELRSCLTAC